MAGRVRQQQTCVLDVMLFTEQVPRADAIMSSLFPVNALRCALRQQPWSRRPLRCVVTLYCTQLALPFIFR